MTAEDRNADTGVEATPQSETAHVTSTLNKVADIADRLAFGLRQTALNHSNESLASTSLRDLLELLPVVRETLEDIHRRQQVEWIARAAGNATSHTWHVKESGVIRCAACGCGPMGYLLATGSVPLCTPNPDCQHNIFGARADEVPSGSGQCLHCKTTYPPTAGLVTA